MPSNRAKHLRVHNRKVKRHHKLRMEYLRKYTDRVSKRAELRFQRKKNQKSK